MDNEDTLARDPRDFLGTEGDDKRSEEYLKWCRAVQDVLSCPAGEAFLLGLKQLVGYDCTVFRSEDQHNTHAAAARDGARGLITEIVVASKIRTHVPRNK